MDPCPRFCGCHRNRPILGLLFERHVPHYLDSPQAPRFTQDIGCHSDNSWKSDYRTKTLGKIWERTQNLKTSCKSHRINGPTVLVRTHKTMVDGGGW